MNLRTVFASLLMFVGSIAGAQTAAVVTAVTGERASDGSVSVSGKTVLPAGSRLSVSIEQSNAIVYADVNSKGEFTARGIGRVGRPILDTSIMVRIEATVGVGEQARVVETTAQLTIAPISNDAGAKLLAAWRRDSLEIAGRPIVEAVKNAVIQLSDGRTSSVPVRNAIHWNEWMGKFKPGVWSVQQPGADEWIVTLGSSDRNHRGTAQWSYNTATKEVRTLDSLAATLSYRRVPLLACVAEADSLAAQLTDEGRKKPATITQLVILPIPVPPIDAAYKLEAVFLVDAIGNGELLEWTRPNDPAWARRVVTTLGGYRFRPAIGHDGKPTCGRAVIRVSLDGSRRR